MDKDAAHIPVMLTEVVDALAPRRGGIYVDATFGRGGYSRALLKAADCRVYAIDRDPDAIAAGQDMVKEFAPRLTLLQGPFGAMDVLLAGQHVFLVDGIALDLGVSSPQINQPSRGFSFGLEGPLDMRMSKSGPSAADVVNEMPEQELANVFYEFGEERRSRNVARGIAEARQEKRLTSTTQLAEIVRKAVPRSKDGIDPATRTFQALRIYVNDEIGELNRALDASEKILKARGRLAVVSFHSLEDRAVKNFLRQRSGAGHALSRYMPMQKGQHKQPSFRLIFKKPQTPSKEEIASNTRARSAKLRVAERIDLGCEGDAP